MLLVIGYQNLVTYPGLRAAANQPRLLPWTPLHGATRGAHLAITADHEHGVVLPIDLPQPPSIGAYASYSFDLTDPQGKQVWTGAVAAPGDEAGDSQRISLVIPGAMLQQRHVYSGGLRRYGAGRTHQDRPIRLRSSFNRLTRPHRRPRIPPTAKSRKVSTPMPAAKEKMHIFNAEATVLSGKLLLPVAQIIEPQAHAMLDPKGGYFSPALERLSA